MIIMLNNDNITYCCSDLYMFVTIMHIIDMIMCTMNIISSSCDNVCYCLYYCSDNAYYWYDSVYSMYVHTTWYPSNKRQVKRLG